MLGVRNVSYQFGWNSIWAVSGVVANYAFGGWNQSLGFLALLVVVDYVTGIGAAIKEGRSGKEDAGLNSSKGFWGICKKALIFVVIAIMHRADLLLGIEGEIGLMLGVTYFYIANELISITENLGRMNFPMPPQIKQLIAVLKNKSGDSK
ncbi:phage holin family protein [Paenibacillus sp. IB182363]|uniref:Phage holin family protein n=2 Tax=Paenibacillus oceani TaxID=2772510 RepID=A0A927H0B5_9BACL|nr:phage holin family protein [Paenibacillus oceani]